MPHWSQDVCNFQQTFCYHSTTYSEMRRNKLQSVNDMELCLPEGSFWRRSALWWSAWIAWLILVRARRRPGLNSVNLALHFRTKCIVWIIFYSFDCGEEGLWERIVGTWFLKGWILTLLFKMGKIYLCFLSKKRWNQERCFFICFQP